ncbi:MAG: P1 family peptidase [Arenicellales bacterium]
MTEKRARELGLDLPGMPRQHNAITDVSGLMVGYTTLISGEGPLMTGRGPVRTGVTAILPRGREPVPQPVWAGTHSLNGNGEMTGTHWIQDGGYLLGPIMISNTHSVGRVHQAAVKWIIDTYPEHWGSEHLWAMPVVAETYDGTLNDINGLHVTEAHAWQALDEATDGPILEGNVGGGTGMICYEFKGGTGTASRRISVGGQEFHVGVLVQANHGKRQDLAILGVPVGRYPQNDMLFPEHEMGSIIAVIATDAPMFPHQLERLAKRGAIGIARGGTCGGNGSGDIFLAMSTANPMPIDRMGQINSDFSWIGDNLCDTVYQAAVEAIEESVINALLAAEDMTTLRPPDRRCAAINIEAMLEIMDQRGQLRKPSH